MERLQRNFIWGNSQHSKGFHPIGWDQIVRPKVNGGLGFKKLSSFNRAYGAKIAWKLVNGDKGLWVDVLLHKYMLRNEDNLLEARKGNSALWKFISK